MRHLSDKALARLRNGAELPDLSGTRYRLIEQVARGGMGVVYAAEDQFLQRRVALKVIEEVLEVSGNESDLAKRLLREARVLARLEHPGIVPVHDAGTLADGRVFYAMKFVEGQRLDRYIESLASVPDRLRIFMSICDAVAFAHAHGVLHRDLKPANVMVGLFGEVLVMDWGLAKNSDGCHRARAEYPRPAQRKNPRRFREARKCGRDSPESDSSGSDSRRYEFVEHRPRECARHARIHVSRASVRGDRSAGCAQRHFLSRSLVAISPH